MPSAPELLADRPEETPVPDPHATADIVPARPRAPRRLIAGLGIGALAIAVIGTVAHLLAERAELPRGVGALAVQLDATLYPDIEGNVWTWYSAVLLAVLGIAFAVVAAVMRRTGGDGRPYVVLAVVAVFLSVDEAGRIHERFGLITDVLGIRSELTYNWLLIGIPLAVVVGAVLLWVTRAIDRRLRLRLVLAGAVYLAGAAGLEIVGGVIRRGLDVAGDLGAAVLYNLAMLLEELAELGGVLIALAAVLALFRVRQADGALLVSVDVRR